MSKRAPPPIFCTKEKPCDYDPPTSYCPHRECRKRAHELVDALYLCKPRALALKEISALMREAGATEEDILIFGRWIEATEKADELMKVDPRPPV